MGPLDYRRLRRIPLGASISSVEARCTAQWARIHALRVQHRLAQSRAYECDSMAAMVDVSDAASDRSAIAAGVQWMPLLDYVDESALAGQKFDPSYLIGLVFPYANGYPADGVTPVEIRRATGLPNTNELSAGFVGWVTFFLAALTLVFTRERRTWTWWFMVALIAGLGWAGLEYTEETLIEAGKLNVRGHYAVDRGPSGHAVPQQQREELVHRIHKALIYTCLRLLIPVALFLYLVFALCRRNVGYGPWWFAATAELLMFALPYNSGAPIETYFPNAPAIDLIRSHQQKREGGSSFRIAGSFRAFRPEIATAYRLGDIRGYDSLGTARYYRWMDSIQPASKPPRQVISKVFNPDAKALRLLNLGYLVTAPHHAGPGRGWQQLTPNDPLDERQARVYALEDAMPRAWAAVGNPAEATYEMVMSERIRVRVSQGDGGWLVIADSFQCGWRATYESVDHGSPTTLPILPAYGVLRAVPLPRDRLHPIDVIFEYRPNGWRNGLRMSFAGTGMIVILLLLSMRKTV